uniref:DNA-directed RNA polymerase n=1 Tax=Paradoxia multiseta TaxID=249350 RepID=A0A097KP66_9CHLO|nr:alpha subunit of RNA polymerase [Paradoxia multiseta]AIT94952.1 alpha subunit of RNA polymerase [Paradoxia multiseta]
MEHLVLSCLESRLEENGSIYGRFLLGPFKVGQGTTIGTALRRTLLSELQSLAITAAEIKGATHQYSSIPGVRESTLDIVLNLKQIVLTGEIINGLPAVGYLTVQGPKTARARDLKLPNGICCVDEDQHIASVSANGVLTIKFVVSAGKNYVSPHSPSAQTLAPSLFQPKMREGSTIPLALRASGQPFHRLVEMVGRNSPQDVRHGQHPLFREKRLFRLTGGIDDVVVANVARRGAYAAALKSVDSSSALITNAEAARFSATPSILSSPKPGLGPFWLRDNTGSEATGQQEDDKPSLLASRHIVETSQSRFTEHREAGQANRFFLGRDQAPRFRSVKATNLFPGIEEGEGGVFAAGIQQVSTDKPGNTQESTQLGDDNRFIEMTLGETQASSTAPSDGQVLAGLAQRGRQWEANSAPLPIDAVFMPVKKVNFALQIDDQWQEPRERVILEIWTNGSIHPRQAINEAATSLVYLFSLFRQADARSAPIPLARLRPRWSGWGAVDQRGRGSLKTLESQKQEDENRNGDLWPSSRQNTLSRILQDQANGRMIPHKAPSSMDGGSMGWGRGPTARPTERRTSVNPSQGQGCGAWGSWATPGHRGGGSAPPTAPSHRTPRNSSAEALTDNTRHSSIDVANLDLSVQAYAVLKRAGINTLGDLMNSSLDSVLLNPSISREIEATINSLG